MVAITRERSNARTEQLRAPGSPDHAAPFRRETPGWLQRHFRLLVASDVLAAAAATLIARVAAFGWDAADLQVRSMQIPYTAAVVVTVPAWLLVIATVHCYDVGPFGWVTNGTRRVVRAGAQFLAMIAVAYYVIRFERLGREFLITIVPLAVALTLLGRAAVTYRLQRQRDRGRCLRRAMIMGSRRNVNAVLDHLAKHPRAGVMPVATLRTDHEPGARGETAAVPTITDTADAAQALETIDADLLLITDGLAPGELRRLTWRLEATGVPVLVAPAAHVAGPQFDVRPVAGLPLLYVDGSTLGDGAGSQLITPAYPTRYGTDDELDVET